MVGIMKTWLTDPSPAGLLLLLAVLALCAALCTSIDSAGAQEPTTEQAGVEDAISWLLRPAPNRKLSRDVSAQKSLAAALVEAGTRYDLSPYLLLTIAYHEGSLRISAKGKLGEVGFMQIMRPRQRGCELTREPLSHALCGAKIFRQCLDICGDEWGAMALYGSGKTCSPSLSSSWARRVQKRMVIYKKLEARFGKTRR